MLKELIFYTINNIFKKAVSQPVYCPHYVKLLNILDKKFQIRDIIDKKCAEFKNVTNKENNHKQNDTNDSEECVETQNINKINLEQRKYDEFCEEIKVKNLLKDIPSLINELYKNNMIKYETLKISISMFFDNLFEELKMILRVMLLNI